MNWHPISTAPKDQQILLDVGMPWAVVGIWNEYEQEWVFADLAMNVCDGTDDPYFENEREKAPTAWQHLPEIKREARGTVADSQNQSSS